MDASQPTIVAGFSSEEFEALNGMFASLLNRKEPDDLMLVEPSAERWLQALGKVCKFNDVKECYSSFSCLANR